jgi:hypothetical protein
MSDTRRLIQDVVSQHCGDNKIAQRWLYPLCQITVPWRHGIGMQEKASNVSKKIVQYTFIR